MASRRNRRPASAQQTLDFGKGRPPSHGGARKGAGRKRKKGPGRQVGHGKRQRFGRHQPVHVTLRVLRNIPNLRTWKRAQAIRRAFVLGCKKPGFRIIDWSILGNHLHLVVEADSALALSKGMQGFSIRVAKAINRVAGGRRGSVFAGRYHSEVLKNPTQVRNARRYVIHNYRKHAGQKNQKLPRNYVDVHSSWAWFSGWRNLPVYLQRLAAKEREDPAPVAEARGWLLTVGWKQRGRLGINEVPASR